MSNGLRFDRVAVELVDRVKSGVSDAVPSGVTVLFSLTAPIRMPAKTATALRDANQTPARQINSEEA